MTSSAFDAALRRDRTAVESRAREIVEARDRTISEALGYAVLGGGKRVRPLLCLWTHDVFAPSGRRAAALDAACALEFLHTYSLVHDDLPCMDDDDLRRGRPSLHRRFGEATAVLAGDALLTLAFETLAALDAPAGVALDAVRVLAAAAGADGLIAGQALDLAATASGEDGRARVERIHDLKTARVIAASMEIGALTAWEGSPPPAGARARVRESGLLAGSAFQIVDDLLDLAGDAKTLGKTPRKDVDRGKLTFPAVAGVTEAEAAARERIARALAGLPEAAGTPLAELLTFVVERRS